ncbi:MAG TPA: hypothetical protein VIK14_16350 [Ignavibacteria bacterium]
MKKLVYTDEKFILQMSEEIQTAKTELQRLLDLYNSFNLRSITTYKELFRLIFDPYTVWKDAGSSDPLRNEIYVQCRKTKENIHIGRLDLWNISEDGKTVILNDVEFQRFTHTSDIFCENDTQAKFARDIIKYVELSNSINATLMALPTDRALPGVPFSLTGRYFPYLCCLKLETELLQEILKSM